MDVLHLEVVLAELSEGNVGYNNSSSQAKKLAIPTEGLRCSEVGDAEEASDGLTFLYVQVAPKVNEGKFVKIFDELTREWAARRNIAT
jgi:hypothetical protein